MEEWLGVGTKPSEQRLKRASDQRRLRRIGPFHVVPVAVVLLLVGFTTAATALVHLIVQNQERKLLIERANEVNLVLTTSITTVSTDLSVLARDAGRGGPTEFVQEAQAQLASSPGADVSLGLLRPSDGTFVVLASTGGAWKVGESLSGAPATAMKLAEGDAIMVATGVYGSGASRSLGFALRAPGGLVVYRQSILGPVRPPGQAGSAPFSELRVVVFTSARPDASQVLVATAGALPLHGQVRYAPLMAGSSKWLTGVSAIHPLVGSVATAAPWVVLGTGLVGSALVFLLLEGMAYRRDFAVEAAETEHRFAEALQRRLLPTVPTLDGLDVAAIYVPGADHQQVGGDWFDVFELRSGQVAVVIGDVMGHDVDAAATMAQLRAALRSYTAAGSSPARTIEQLADFIELFGIPAVVTVICGILDVPGADGSRRFSWANAGHLPPLLRHPSGRVKELGEASSPLLGAPSARSRPTGHTRLGLGSTLLLYTDGLVEIEGEDLTVTVDHLKEVLQGADFPTAQEICDAVLEEQVQSSRRDDVALLVVKVAPRAPSGEPTIETAASAL